MTNVQNIRSIDRASWVWPVALWSTQLLLALFFGMTGLMKTFMSPEALLANGVSSALDLPYWLLRFIGISEIAGAIGIILPAATRILPFLTPLAALGFASIQVLAIGFHTMRGEFVMLPLNFALLGLALLVAWGRTKKLVVASRF